MTDEHSSTGLTSLSSSSWLAVSPVFPEKSASAKMSKSIKNISTLFYECMPEHYNYYRTCITEESMLAPFRGDVQKWYGSTKKVIFTTFTAFKYRQIQYKYKGVQGEQYSGALHLHKYHLLRSSQRCCC